MPRYRLLLLTLWLMVGVFGRYTAYGQSAPDAIRLSGTVLDNETFEPLQFASVIENQSNGTATDADGSFGLRVQRKAVVRITYVGYKTFQIRIPEGFAGSEYVTEVLLEKDLILLKSVRVKPLTEDEFKDQFMDLKVETEEEKNARSNLAKVRAQGILGVIPQMDGFDNYRNYLNGPQGVTFLSFSLGKGASKSRGVAPALKKAFTNPNRFSGPERGMLPGSAPARDKWNFNKPVPPPTQPDTTRQPGTPPVDTLKQKPGGKE